MLFPAPAPPPSLTLAVFLPSVSDIDVSHKGLRGAG